MPCCTFSFLHLESKVFFGHPQFSIIHVNIHLINFTSSINNTCTQIKKIIVKSEWFSQEIPYLDSLFVSAWKTGILWTNTEIVFQILMHIKVHVSKSIFKCYFLSLSSRGDMITNQTPAMFCLFFPFTTILFLFHFWKSA